MTLAWCSAKSLAFLSWLQEDPEVYDCYLELLRAGVYNVIRNAYDIKDIYSEIALVKQTIKAGCGNGVENPETMHTLLDGLGFIPVIGEGFDIVNGLLYIKEGDFYNAGFSFIAIVPVIGDAVGKGTKYIIKVIKVNEEVFNNAKRVITAIKALPAATRKALSNKILNLSKPLRTKLLADILGSPELLEKIFANPNLIDTWRKEAEASIDDIIRRHPDFITKIDNAIAEGLDWQDALEDAIITSQKIQPTWPQIQALYKRGNDFNRKGRLKYTDDFVEIVLKGVNGKPGKRLDTYLPPSNGNPGKIISRKATTLSNIQTDTFKSYLNELITKYPKGAELNSTKFPSGTKLVGNYKLEIPKSNESFFASSTEFQSVLSNFNLSKGVNIEIIYLIE